MTSILTADIDDRFWPELRAVAIDVGCDALDLLKVIFSESGARADAHNPHGGASGLLQFMPATLIGLGWTADPSSFRRLTSTEQLAFVRRYLKPHRGRLGSIGQLYTAVFLPALLPHATDPAYVLVAKGGQLGWAYSANAALDANGDLTIVVGELEQAVRRNAAGARWRELVQRFDGVFHPGANIRTIAGVQYGLTALGYGPGPLDGVWGPRTRAAVVSFQKAAAPPLVPDGIVGPKTRAALRTALAPLGVQITG